VTTARNRTRPDLGYPGSSFDKRAIQSAVYALAADAPRIGHALTLVGTDAPPLVRLLRDRLAWPAERTWYVDWAKCVLNRPRVLAALATARAMSPRSNVCREAVEDVLDRIPLVGFADLDLMGNVQPHEAIRRTIPKMLVGSVMSTTWLRGRERAKDNVKARAVLEMADDVDDLNGRRWTGMQRLVAGWASEAGVRLELVLAEEYWHNRSAMAVGAWRRVE